MAIVDLREKIAALPRVKIICGRDWYWGPSNYRLAVLWKKNKNAQEGEIVYERCFGLRFAFSLKLEWW